MAKHLTQEQRYYICLQIANFIPQKEIARRIGVSKLTISKELKRNSRNIGDYDSDYAGKKAALTRSKASKAKVFSKLLAHHGKTYKAKQALANIITNGVDISQRPKIVE